MTDIIKNIGLIKIELSLLILNESFFSNPWFNFVLVFSIVLIILFFLRYIKTLKYTLHLEKEYALKNNDLISSQLKYKYMFEDNQAVMLIINSDDGRIKSANKSAIEYYGYDESEIIGMPFSNIDHLYEVEYRPVRLYEKSYSQNFYTTQHKLGNGTLRDVELYFSLIPDNDDRIVFVIVHDINEKKLAEEAYIESEERYRILINNMRDGVFLMKSYKIQYLNVACAAMLGYKTEELINKYPKHLIHKEDIISGIRHIRNLLSGHKLSDEFEFRLIHKASGNTVYVSINLSLINYGGYAAFLGTVKNITIRKKQDEQLRKLSAVVEQSPISIIITDTDGFIEYVNPTFNQITGYSLHEVFKQKPSILKSGKMNLETYSEMWSKIKNGKIWNGELINKKKNGELYWVSSAVSPIKNNGVITHFIAMQMDISFEKYAIDEIEQQKNKITSLIDNLPVILFSLNEKLEFTLLQGKGLEQFNPELINLLGVNAKIVFENNIDIINDLNIVVKGESLKVIRHIMNHFFEIIYIPRFDKENVFDSIYGFAYDITNRVEAERALKESEERFRGIYENNTIAIYRTNLKGEFLLANNKMVELLGYESFDEIRNINESSKQFNIQFDRKLFLDLLRKDKIINGFESVWVRSNDDVVYIRESARAKFDSDGEIEYIDGVIEDITDKKKAEQELIKSEMKNRAMLNAVPDIIFEINIDGEILNSHFSEMEREEFELPRDMNNRNIKEIADVGFNRILFNYMYKALECNEVQHFEYTKDFINKSNYYEVRVIASGASTFIVIIRNITYMKESEKFLIAAKEEAEKSDKLKSEFLAQMSHEIRTPVNSILSFTSLLKEELINKVPDELKVSFDAIDNGGRRLIRTIDSILNMSQLQTGTYQPTYKLINLDTEIIKVAVGELTARARNKNLELNYVNQAKDSILYGDEYTLGQIFINLIDNAIKYTGFGKIEVVLYNNAKNEIQVDIIDTGIGISEEYIPQLFRPFSQEDRGYTRKYEGNGLGLALVKKYLDINFAEIFVESKKGKGSRFGIIFNKQKII